MEVEKKEEWSEIDTSKPESKEEDKVDFEVENSSKPEKEENVKAVVEEKPVAETKTETKEDTQPEEQPDEAKDIESERAQKKNTSVSSSKKR